MLISTFGMGRADGTGFAGAIQGILGHHRAGLAQAVAFDERDAEFLFESRSTCTGSGAEPLTQIRMGSGEGTSELARLR